jgi:5,10-methenyltetrahydrofolate synthetase
VDGQVVDQSVQRDVAVFRKAERSRLYALRKQHSVKARTAMARDIAGQLSSLLGAVSGKRIAAYWPIKGELDLRPWMNDASDAGATVSLPVVVRKNQPVEFHAWQPNCKMKRGHWNIPVPADAKVINPQIVIVPLVGVDENRFRLGNGGGYYDRTLARLPKDVNIIGVGEYFAQMKTIFPMPWDIPMKHVLLASDPFLEETGN